MRGRPEIGKGGGELGGVSVLILAGGGGRRGGWRGGEGGEGRGNGGVVGSVCLVGVSRFRGWI